MRLVVLCGCFPPAREILIPQKVEQARLEIMVMEVEMVAMKVGEVVEKETAVKEKGMAVVVTEMVVMVMTADWAVKRVRRGLVVVVVVTGKGGLGMVEKGREVLVTGVAGLVLRNITK